MSIMIHFDYERITVIFYYTEKNSLVDCGQRIKVKHRINTGRYQSNINSAECCTILCTHIETSIACQKVVPLLIQKNPHQKT